MPGLRSSLPRAAVAACAWAGVAWAAPPAYDHVVVVVEENHSLNQVIGSASAPYLNSLAAGGVSFTNFYGITHPSQPNYLELFSGSSQGVTSDALPTGTPFTSGNLGAGLIAAGRTFAGYSQSMPAVGYNGDTFTTVAGQSQYQRKHNPWANWQASGTPGTNQFSDQLNRPFDGFFPTTAAGYAALPHVSFVVPDEQNDMHDGSIAQADEWLQTNIKGYADWAVAHNSLLVVTFDEDESASNNKIPTVFYGASLKNGTTNAKTHTLHNLLRTLADVHGAAAPGQGAKTRSIVGAFTTDPTSTTVRLQNGVGGYTSAHDTYIEAGAPTATHGSDTVIVADGSLSSQALIRFDSLIGSDAGQVPAGATILSAKLIINTGTTASDESASSMELHRMLQAWSESTTWSSLTGGVSADGTESLAASDFDVVPGVNGNSAIFDVTSSIAAWAAGATNNGWAVLPTGTDGWRFGSAETATAPILEVTYAVPEPAGLSAPLGVTLLGALRRPRRAAR